MEGFTITTHCPECRVEIKLDPTLPTHRRSCSNGHRWAITVSETRATTRNPNVTQVTYAINFTPLKPGRTLASAREDLIKKALREVPRLYRAEWRKASPSERASLIKRYVEQFTS